MSSTLQELEASRIQEITIQINELIEKQSRQRLSPLEAERLHRLQLELKQKVPSSHKESISISGTLPKQEALRIQPAKIMIPYHLASNTLKSTLETFLKQFLLALNATEHFAITVTLENTLTIRDRTRSNRPSPSETTSLTNLLTHLKDCTLLEFISGVMATNFGLASTLTITQIHPNLELLLKSQEAQGLIRQFATATPILNSGNSPAPFATSPARANILEGTLQQYGWKVPAIHEAVDYSAAISIDGSFFIRDRAQQGVHRNELEGILLDLGWKKLNSSGSFGYTEFGRTPNPNPVPQQRLSTPSSSNAPIPHREQNPLPFLTPNAFPVSPDPEFRMPHPNIAPQPSAPPARNIPLVASTPTPYSAIPQQPLLPPGSSSSRASFANPGPQFLPPPATNGQPKPGLCHRVLGLQRISDDEAVEIKATLDPLILRHWNKFSPALREHILQCKRGNLQSKFNFLQTVNFSAFESPIGMALSRDIPVRLPSSDTAENKKYYNLIELLQLSPPKDPCTNLPFNLKDIRPAPEALEEFKEKIRTPTARLNS